MLTAIIACYLVKTKRFDVDGPLLGIAMLLDVAIVIIVASVFALR